MTLTRDMVFGKLYARRILAPRFPFYCDACDNLAAFALFRGARRTGLSCPLHLPEGVAFPEERKAHVVDE